LVRRGETWTRRQRVDARRKRLRAHVGRRALARLDVGVLFDARDAADDLRARFVRTRFGGLRLIVDRFDLLLDVEKFAARARRLVFDLRDLRVRFRQALEVDQTVRGRRNLRQSELEIARTEHECARAQYADHRDCQYGADCKLVEGHGHPFWLSGAGVPASAPRPLLFKRKARRVEGGF
jgi:hypothetical protein